MIIIIKWQFFTIDIDSNRIKLLPHWRLEIQKPQGTNQQRVCNEVPNLTETEACYRCSDIPRYGTKDNCNILKIFLIGIIIQIQFTTIIILTRFLASVIIRNITAPGN